MVTPAWLPFAREMTRLSFAVGRLISRSYSQAANCKNSEGFSTYRAEAFTVFRIINALEAFWARFQMFSNIALCSLNLVAYDLMKD
jgi:hypothetical protein